MDEEWKESFEIAMRLVAAWGLEDREQLIGNELGETLRWARGDEARLGRLLWCLAGISHTAAALYAERMEVDELEVYKMIETGFDQVLG